MEAVNLENRASYLVAARFCRAPDVGVPRLVCCIRPEVASETDALGLNSLELVLNTRKPEWMRRLVRSGAMVVYGHEVQLVSGRKPLDNPMTIRLLCVAEAVMEPVWAALPELDARWTQDVPSPIGW